MLVPPLLRFCGIDRHRDGVRIDLAIKGTPTSKAVNIEGRIPHSLLKVLVLVKRWQIHASQHLNRLDTLLSSLL